MNPLDLVNGETEPTPRAVKLNGRVIPGKSWPTGAGSPRKWDEQGGYGFSGATLIYIGNGLSEFDIVVQVGWEKTHWAEWNLFAPILTKAPKGERAKAIEIEHPMVNRAPIGITKIVVVDVTQFEQVSGGLFECRIKCKDARVAMPALGKTDGISGFQDAGTAQLSPEDVKTNELKAKVASLGAKLNASQGVTP